MHDADKRILLAMTVDGVPRRVLMPWTVAERALGKAVGSGSAVIDFAMARRAEIHEIVRQRSATSASPPPEIELEPGDVTPDRPESVIAPE